MAVCSRTKRARCSWRVTGWACLSKSGIENGVGTGTIGSMSNWKEGDRVRVVTREVTAEDRNANRYFSHMAGVVGTVQNVYGKDEIAIKVDPSSLSPISADV